MAQSVEEIDTMHTMKDLTGNSHAEREDVVDSDSIKKLLSNPRVETEMLKQLSQKYGRHELMCKLDAFNEISHDEPILDPSNRKFTAFPIKYPDIWQMYKEQKACMWKAEEIDFSNDYADFQSLNKDEQYLVEMILAFFAASDGIVNFNLGERFVREIQITEAQFAYAFQEMMENIHSETYALMLENLVKDPERKDFLYDAVQNVPSVKRMADWALKWIESPKEFAYRIIAFACVEAIFFSGAFAVIFWFKKYKNNARDNAKGKPFMNGLITSNKFIARDEGMHCKFACLIYGLLHNKLPFAEVAKIIKESVVIAKQFMVDALPIRLIGMNSDMMEQYIEYIADILVVMLGYKKIYNKVNPFKFMETIGLNDRTNLHDLRPTEYADAHVMNKNKKGGIVINDDF